MLPQLDPTWYASQALWMLITFYATFWMMWKFVLPRMNAVLDERQRRLDDDMKKAESFKAEAENVLKEYKNAMASANERAKSLLDNTQLEIAEYSKRRESEFSARLDERIKNGEDELKKQKTSLWPASKTSLKVSFRKPSLNFRDCTRTKTPPKI